MGRRIVILAMFLAVLTVVGFAPAAYAAGDTMGGKAMSGAQETGPNGQHPEYQYVELSPVILPIITTQGLTQQVSLKVQLEVFWGNKDKVSTYEPRLIDAYLQDLYGALSAGSGLLKNSFVNIVAVKQRLTVDTDKVLGKDKDKVHDVLLEVLQQRPL
ncbi:MAG: hypothetical protein KGL10_03205 [Alphaproteobacteria bacterium]|nr:hypothetical protein [Alphaproteobacteria bacterium]